MHLQHKHPTQGLGQHVKVKQGYKQTKLQGKLFKRQHIRDSHLPKSRKQEAFPLARCWRKNNKTPISSSRTGQIAHLEAMLYRNSENLWCWGPIKQVRCHVMGGTWDLKLLRGSASQLRGHTVFTGNVRQNNTPFSFFHCVFLKLKSPQIHVNCLPLEKRARCLDPRSSSLTTTGLSKHACQMESSHALLVPWAGIQVNFLNPICSYIFTFSLQKIHLWPQLAYQDSFS